MKKIMFVAIVISIFLFLSIVGLILVIKDNNINPLWYLPLRYDYEIDVEKNYTSEDELSAIEKCLDLPYEELLNQSRYDKGKDLAEKRTRVFFLDRTVEEDGKEYVNNQKKVLKSGHFTFEFKANCRYFSNITINQKKSQNGEGYEIEITGSDLPVIDSFWANYPPYGGFLRNNTEDPNFPDNCKVYHDGFIKDGIENKTEKYVKKDVYLVIMLAEIGSSHRGGLGNGNGVDQYVILDREFNPELIITNWWDWDA